MIALRHVFYAKYGRIYVSMRVRERSFCVYYVCVCLPACARVSVCVCMCVYVCVRVCMYGCFRVACKAFVFFQEHCSSAAATHEVVQCLKILHDMRHMVPSGAAILVRRALRALDCDDYVESTPLFL